MTIIEFDLELELELRLNDGDGERDDDDDYHKTRQDMTRHSNQFRFLPFPCVSWLYENETKTGCGAAVGLIQPGWLAERASNALTQLSVIVIIISFLIM